MSKGYVGWALPDSERSRLLALFRPLYPDVVAHHVTLVFGVDETHPLPVSMHGYVVGIADDREAVQALVVEIDGTTDRHDGSTYHITWSLDRAKGAKPVDSNKVLKQRGFEKVPRIMIKLIPAYFQPGQ